MIGHVFALKNKTLCKRAAKLAIIIGIVLVVAERLAGGGDMQRINASSSFHFLMKRHPRLPFSRRAAANRCRCLRFQRSDGHAGFRGFANAPGRFAKKMFFAVVLDGMHRVEAQPVKSVLGDPIDRVLDDEFSNPLSIRRHHN